MRDGVAVGVALLLHVSALAVVGVVASSWAPTPKSLPPAPTSDITVDLDETLDLDGPRVPVASGASDEVTASPAPLAAVTRPPPRATVAELAPLAGDGDAAPGPTAAPSLAASAPPAVAAPEAAPRSIDLGLGTEAWTRWLPPSGQGGGEAPLARAPREPLVKAPPASSSGGLQEGLEAADRGRLVGPSGRVVSALESAAHGEGAGAFGVASFAVTVLKTGGVEVTLQSASAGEAEWKRVAERAARDLAKNAPRIPPPREGARFVIDLVAEVMLPDGRRTKDLHGPRVEADPPRVHDWSAGKKDMLERNPLAASGLMQASPDMRANVELPGVYVAENGKVCSYRFGLSVLGPLLQGGCELSNIGAKPQRVVHARVRNQELF